MWWFTLKGPKNEMPPAHMLFLPPLNCPTSPPTSESVMRSLCHYSNNAVNDVPAPVTTPVWCTPWEHIQQTAGIFSLLSLRWGGGGVKINKWQSNSGYANLISHASCVLPCLLGSSQLRLQGKWQRIGLIWVISSVMIMRLCTLFVAGTKGHINKRRFELMCKRSGTQSTYIKTCVLLQGQRTACCIILILTPYCLSCSPLTLSLYKNCHVQDFHYIISEVYSNAFGKILVKTAV